VWKVTLLFHYSNSGQVFKVTAVLPCSIRSLYSSPFAEWTGFVEHVDIPSLPFSSIKHFLLQNPTVTVAERDRLRDLISQHDAVLSRIDEHIRILNEKLDQAQTIQETLAQRRMKYCSMAAPVGRLPSEILAQIMALSVKVIDGMQREFALTLAAVCGFWRETALSHSELWMDLRLNLSSAPERVEALLATGIPRLLCVVSNSACEHDIERIFKHANRWREITLNQPKHSPSTWDATGYAGTTFPAVEALHFGNQSLSSLPFFDLPRLKHVSFTNSVVNPPQFKLPWSQLTSCKLSGEHMDFSSCLRMLEMCPQLSTLVLKFPSQPTLQRYPQTSLALPNIRTLEVDAFVGGQSLAVPLLHSVSFPGMCHLAIRYGWGDYGAPFCDAGVSLLKEYPEGLTALCLTGMMDKEVFLSRPLLNFNFDSLVGLEVKESNSWSPPHYENFLQRLTLTPDNSFPLPHLQTLKLRNDNLLDTTERGQLLANLITSRWWLGVAVRTPTSPSRPWTLRSVILDMGISCGCDSEAISVLASLRARRFDLVAFRETRGVQGWFPVQIIPDVLRQPGST
jgi:hypothetical protein